jgi:hypothetical protein
VPRPRTLAYAFAFIFPPILIGVVRTFSTAGQVLIQTEPKALDARETPTAPPIAPIDTGKPVALFLLSNASTQVTELLAGYQALGETGRYRLVTAAPDRRLSATTGAVSVLPDTTLAEAPAPAVLVIPAVVDFTNERLIAYLKKSQAPRILTLGEGSSLAAQAGLLDGLKVSTHFNAVDAAREANPAVRWTAARDYQVDGRVFSTAGLAATVEALPFATQWLAGRTPPEAPEHAVEALTPPDFFTLFLHGGYTFIPRSLGVYLTDGVDETRLAALLDTFPRTMSSLMATWSDTRRAVRSRHGLTLVATQDILKNAELPDVLAIPEGSKLEAGAEKWVGTTGLPTAVFPKTPVARDALFGQALAWLEESPFDLADAVPFVAKFTQARARAGEKYAASSGLAWLYRPVLVGILGMLVARWILGRLGRKSRVI